jgi:methylase of polypeptide subunit release factors
MIPHSARLSPADPQAVSLLADRLRAADYHEVPIHKLLNIGPGEAVQFAEAALLMRRLPERGLLPALVRLFYLVRPMEAGAVSRDLAPLSPGALEAMGLVALGPGVVTPRVRIHPFFDLFLASDPHIEDVLSLPPDFVIGVNATSACVAAITIRRPVESALDIGTGMGIQALCAARHCQRVVATDINARALNMAAFNAALNGIRNVEFREGSLFEPVAGETFDLIVSNPPYVISPEKGLQFRDSGISGDSLSRTLVRELPAYLRTGGTASIRCSWALRAGESETSPLVAWVEGSGCDALLLHSSTESPCDYATGWNRTLLARRPEEFETRVDQWLDYFRGLGIQDVATGSLVLRKRADGVPWVRSERMSLMGDPGGGRHIERIFEAQDWLVGSPDARLAIFMPMTDIKIDQAAWFHEGKFGIRDIGISFVSGLQLKGGMEPNLLAILSMLDGETPLGEILERVVPGSGPEEIGIRDRVIESVVRLYSLGFLGRKTTKLPVTA